MDTTIAPKNVQAILSDARDELLISDPNADVVDHLLRVRHERGLEVSQSELRRIADNKPITFSDTFVSKYRGLSLEQVMSSGLEEPEQLVEDVLLRGSSHQIFCGPGEGKTWVALWLMVNLMKRRRTVAYLDMENGPRITVERLRGFGIADVSNLLYTYSPSLGMTEEDRSLYVELLEKGSPELVVFDSLIGCLSACGLDENSNNDVEEWATIYVNEAKSRGCTVLILDHIPHDGNRSRGASRKKDLVDVQWKLKRIDQFDRSTVGYVELIKEKDREAWLPEKVGFSIGGTEDGFVMHRSSGTAIERDSTLTDSATAALTAITSFADRGATSTEWRNATQFKGKLMGESTFRFAKNQLLAGETPLVILEKDTYYRNNATTAIEPQLA